MNTVNTATDAKMPPTFVRYGALKGNANDQTYLRQTERLGEDFPLGSKGGVAARHYFPVDGEYVLKIRLQRAWDSVIRGYTPRQVASLETQLHHRVMGTADAREGVAAFVDRRSPRFSSRVSRDWKPLPNPSPEP